MSKFSAYGLDETKQPADAPGEAGKYLCLWCDRDVGKGMSLCFSNWCICPGCIKTALELHDIELSGAWDGIHTRWKVDVGCFKCNTLCLGFETDGTYECSWHLCKSCIDLGNDLLNKKDNYIAMKKEVKTITGTLLPIKLSQITVSSTNPRKTFEDDAIKELAESIKVKGVIQPVLLRPLGKDTYELVCGERRYRASHIVKDAPMVNGMIPAYIRDMSDDEALELQITENLQRADVHPMQEAAAFKALVDNGHPPEELSNRLGKTVYFINQRLKLNALTEVWQKLFFYNCISLTDALKIALLKPEHQEDLAEEKDVKIRDPKIVAHFSIHQYDLRSYQGRLLEAPFPLDDAQIDKKAGACNGCPYNSATGNLFPEQANNPICNNPGCFKGKSNKVFDKNLFEASQEPSVLLVAGWNANEKIIEQLNGQGMEIVARGTYHEIDVPEKLDFTEWKEDNEYEFDTEAELLDAWEKALKENEEEFKDYDHNISSGIYHKAFVVDGNDKGRYIYIKLQSKKASGKTAGNPVATVGDTIESVKEEIQRLETKEKRSIELDEEKIHERVIEALASTEFWNNDTPLNHQELMAGVIYLHGKFGWNAKDELKIAIMGKVYGWGSKEDLFADLIKMPTNEVQVMFNKLLRYVMFDDMKSSIRPSASDKAAALNNIATVYIPQQKSEFKLEQMEKTKKREERNSKRISELQKKLKELEAKSKPKKQLPGRKSTAKLNETKS